MGLENNTNQKQRRTNNDLNEFDAIIKTFIIKNIVNDNDGNILGEKSWQDFCHWRRFGLANK